MSIFNPYKDAATDYAENRRATHKYWKLFCCKCSREKPLAGGKVKGVKGQSAARLAGQPKRFVCADCLAAQAAQTAAGA